VTLSETSTGAITVTGVVLEMLKDVAVIVLPPRPTALASPPLVTVATDGALEVHKTDEVRFWVLPSL
jgi:hypothetical protein